jgi:hypothetical protein
MPAADGRFLLPPPTTALPSADDGGSGGVRWCPDGKRTGGMHQSGEGEACWMMAPVEQEGVREKSELIRWIEGTAEEEEEGSPERDPGSCSNPEPAPETPLPSVVLTSAARIG